MPSDGALLLLSFNLATKIWVHLCGKAFSSSIVQENDRNSVVKEPDMPAHKTHCMCAKIRYMECVFLFSLCKDVIHFKDISDCVDVCLTEWWINDDLWTVLSFYSGNTRFLIEFCNLSRVSAHLLRGIIWTFLSRLIEQYLNPIHISRSLFYSWHVVFRSFVFACPALIEYQVIGHRI